MLRTWTSQTMRPTFARRCGPLLETMPVAFAVDAAASPCRGGYRFCTWHRADGIDHQCGEVWFSCAQVRNNPREGKTGRADPRQGDHSGRRHWNGQLPEGITRIRPCPLARSTDQRQHRSSQRPWFIRYDFISGKLATARWSHLEVGWCAWRGKAGAKRRRPSKRPRLEDDGCERPGRPRSAPSFRPAPRRPE